MFCTPFFRRWKKWQKNQPSDDKAVDPPRNVWKAVWQTNRCVFRTWSARPSFVIAFLNLSNVGFSVAKWMMNSATSLSASPKWLSSSTHTRDTNARRSSSSIPATSTLLTIFRLGYTQYARSFVSSKKTLLSWQKCCRGGGGRGLPREQRPNCSTSNGMTCAYSATTTWPKVRREPGRVQRRHSASQTVC